MASGTLADTTAAVEIFEFPCSFAQQRLWIDDCLAPGNPFYNIHASIRIPAALDAAELERTLAALVRRHETLRTTFAERDGRPLQHVASAGRCDFACEDLRALASAEREAHIVALAQSEAAHPFDLARGPLLRVRWLRSGAAEGVLMLTIHHIVADAWSMGLLLRELTALYGQSSGAGAAALPDLAIQYADYAVWQQGGQGQRFEAALRYWRERLQGLEPLELPTDRPRPTVASHRGRTLRFGLDEAPSQRLLRYAQQSATTPYVVLLAALAVVLQRNSGQDELVVGVPVAGRDRPELEGLIGFFVNTLVLRLDLAGGPSFDELVARVQHSLHEALAHQELPFERLVQELARERDLSRHPLFQVSVQYLAAPGVATAVQGATAATVLEVQRGSANFDLSFDFWRSGGRIEARVDYATDLFEVATVERWVAQWQRVLAQALAEPARTIEAIDLLSEAERSLLLGAWAYADAAPSCGRDLASAWTAVLQRASEAPALRAPGLVWSRAELDVQAQRYAALLATCGVQPGDAVGIALPRGAEQVAALIGVLRLGACYVALHADWPAARLAQAMVAAAVRFVICLATDARSLATQGATTLTPQHLPPPGTQAPSPAATAALAPAYISFTSGSTGEPKGVVVPQRAVLRLVQGNPQVPIAADDRMLVFAPLAFDASTLELWGSLLNGACLSIPPAGPLGLEELAHWIEAEHISIAWLTAGLFHQLAAVHPASLARIRRLYAGGDVLGGDAVRRVLAAGDGTNTVFNGYGPTENTTFTCVHAMQSMAEVDDPVPIGRPIAGGYVRVVDARGRLAPPGVAGELLAGGDGLALGYLGDPALTAVKFVSDPFGPPGARVYRTGDRVRWRADGTLSYLGRIDRQLKVRGYRIEPGEVEAALRSLAGVGDAHVMARADASGDKRLVAHVACSDPAASPAALLRQLGTKLPAWMLPSELHLHAQLRLNANGKIDEAVLLAAAALSPAAAPMAPAGPADAGVDPEVEGLVLQVFEDVLGHSVGAATAGFFTDLGGHSLLATQVVSRLSAALGVALPLAAIFEAPSARGVALRLQSLLLEDVQELQEGAA